MFGLKPTHKKHFTTIRLNWHLKNSIKDLPKGFWDKKVSPTTCLNGSKFIEVIENIVSNGNISYLLAYDENQKIIACCLVNHMRLDLMIELPKYVKPVVQKIRRIWPNFLQPKIVQTGTLESYGNHFWYDDEYLSFEQFAEFLKQGIEQNYKGYNVILFRDFIIEKMDLHMAKEFNGYFPNRSFKRIIPMPVAHLNLNGITDEDHYLRTLKSKDRYTIRKAIKKRQKAKIQVQLINDYVSLIEHMYPMYLKVNARAKEFKSHPLPISFFHEIKRVYDDDAYALFFKKENKIIGYTLIIETNNSMNIFLVGIDYKENIQIDLMYNILWEGISIAIFKNLGGVELGVSNYFIKERFGAKIMPLNMLVTGGNPLMKLMLKWFVRSPKI